LCSNCRKGMPTPKLAFESLPGDVELPEHIFKANEKGCNRCGGQGYIGRIAIAEVLEVTEPVSFAIANGANGGDILKIAKEDGMVPMYQEGLYNVLDGITSLEELARVIN